MFPSRVVESAIRDEITSAINDRPMPIAEWEPEVDSLVMVRVILRIEEEFALNLPDDVMPAGGFSSIEHCVVLVIETCHKLWKAKKLVIEEV
jgi:acyl carrier protein